MRNEEKVRKQFECLGLSQENIDFYMQSEMSKTSNPTLAPLVLFDKIWEATVRRGDNDWLTSTIDNFEMRKKLDGIAAARWPENDDFLNSLKAVVDSGIDLNHITNIVRQAQEHLMYQVAYVLSNSYIDEELHGDVNWAVYQTDEDDKPIRRMGMLHELYHAVDPEEKET